MTSKMEEVVRLELEVQAKESRIIDATDKIMASQMKTQERIDSLITRSLLGRNRPTVN